VSEKEMKEMNKQFTQRKTPRVDWLDYNEGMYFITVCTRKHKHLFGEIHDNKIALTEVGAFLEDELNKAQQHHTHIDILQHVVMPNHFHAIINVVGTRRAVSDSDQTKQADTARRVPTREERTSNGIACHRLPLLSTYVGSLKSAVTKYAHKCGMEFAWQQRYHDHMIRGVEDLNNISTYIESNVINWEKDCFYN
jgi:REP element-mobilizing transposase RayT